MSNPIHQLEEPQRCAECNADGCHICDDKGGWPPGWYFWNEVWADRYGPYESEDEANKQLERYYKEVLG